MTGMQRAAIYARVSSTAQRHDQTIKTQLDTLRPYAALRGMRVVGEYIDDGRTAKAGHLDKRDGLARLFADATARRFDVLLVVDVDRLTRSADAGERGQILSIFQRAGVPVITPSATYDMGTSTGDLLAQIAAWKAQEDNRIRSERTIDGQTRSAREGRKPRGPTPMGLRYNRDDRSWSVDPVASEVVREMAERVVAGDSCTAVARMLQDRGIPRPRSGAWTEDRVRSILRSDVYLGRFAVDRGRGLSVPVPAFLEPDLVHAARHALAARYRKPTPPMKHVHLLNRLARCKLCRSLIVMSDTTERRASGKVYVPAYACSRRKRASMTGLTCTLPRLRADRLDEALWSRLVKEMTDRRVFDQALALVEVAAGERPDPGKHELELKRLDTAADFTLASLARGEISQEVSDAQIKRLAARRKDAQAALLTARAAVRGLRSAAAVEVVDALVAGWKRNAPNASPEKRRALLEEALDRAGIDEDAVEIDLGLPIDTILDGHRPAAWSCGGVRVRLAHIVISIEEFRGRRTA